MNTPMTFIFAGGGSGGHLAPGIAVAEELKRRFDSAQIVFVGSTRKIETTMMAGAQRGFEHRTIPAEPLPILKRNPLRFVWRNWQAYKSAARLLKEFRPAAVIGLGGFASAPIVWAARRTGIPIILLEQNVVPGRTTRWLSRIANTVCVAFKATRSQLPRARQIVVTGNPVRAEIAAITKVDEPRSELSQSSQCFRTLLILGGSQGADSLNEAVLNALRQLPNQFANWRIEHQSGPRQVDFVRHSYEQMGLSANVDTFFSDIWKRYHDASLVISRAGATTLAELACAGVPMILVPYPHAMDDHQQANAQAFANHDAAVIVKHAANPATTAEHLAAALVQLIEDAERRNQMSLAARQLANPDAARHVANVILHSIDQDNRHQ